MMRQVEEFQRDVRLKVLAATAATLTLLLAGFAYVARTLDRTQRIHDQAEARLRLASLGALAGGLAHEIRNPLNAMNMNIQLLEEDIAATRGDAPRGQWQETLRATRHEIRRLDELVQNVLTFSRPFEIHVAPVALRELVADLVAFMQPEVARAGVTVDVEIPGGTSVRADAAKLRQALLNVLRNALQAIQASGERGHVRIGFRTEGGVAMLTLEDDGPGIPPGARDRLFRAFASTKPGGTGLGLPIARKVLRAHGGDLQLQPVAPRGTRVTLSLPA
jgi:signal transduction histidine kinase